MNLIDLDGLIVDEETGEIIEVPDGANALDLVAHRLADAKRQAKEWDAIAAIYSAIILREQEDKKAIYGDTVVTQVFSSYETFDAMQWMLDAGGFELTADEWRTLAGHAKGFDVRALRGAEPVLAEFVAPYMLRKDKRPYVTTSTVRRAAPVARRTQREEEGDE